ncbi:hypothetical protein K435DRAFT_774024 [Dendrothele bispora CBS 962.96]|uniref:Mmc1 C-terminal domain-containing protein n=1 Tax=Dendrothele bispora (strain CBS 962.96) TaxID=1314807 RepID=A0A4S8MQ05_DENBC|nr:hypothetical protein K435DRAFT_774024 [Dendrothele bispora CBS 962.96]
MLTVIHKSARFIEQRIPALKSFLDILEVDLARDRPLHVSIAGDPASKDVVTAILDHPFTSDPTLGKALRSRTGSQSLSYAHSVTASSGSLALPSPFFLQFDHDIHIREYSDWSDFISNTLKSDIPVVLINPLTNSLSQTLDIPLLRHNPNTIFVVIASPSHDATQHVRAQYPNANILFMDPSRAVAGLDALHADPSSPVAVQRYQNEFGESKVSDLATHIKSYLESKHSVPVHAAIARLNTLYALSRSHLQDADIQVHSVLESISMLRRTIEEEFVKSQKDILGVYEVTTAESIVAKAFAQATRDMHRSLDKLSWWKALWRIDEISSIVFSMVQNAWCKDLETQLIYHTGRLSTLQNSLTSTSFSILSKHASDPSLNSPVLLNALEQIRSSPFYPVSPCLLTTPLVARRSQLEYPTARLHLAGQQAAIGMGGSVATGAGLGWAGWYGWLTGSEHALAPLLQMDATTAIGAGLLTAALGIRWSVGKWERAKRRWWADWDRVGEGLERDMTKILTKVLKENVAVVADRTCVGLSKLASKRREEIREIRDELDRLQKELNDIQK